MHLSIVSLEGRQNIKQQHKYFSLGKPNWEKTQQPSSRDNNSKIKVQWRMKRKNMEMLSKYWNPENSLLLQCMQNSLFPRKLCTCSSCCVAVVWNNEEGCLLFIVFSHPEFNWDEFTWGSNIILYFILLLLDFHPKAYIVLSRVCMNDYNKFKSWKRTIRIDSEVAQTSTLPLNKEGILLSSSTSWSSGFHLYIYTVSIISKCTKGCLYKCVPAGCLRDNLLLPICLYYRWK